MNISIVPWGIPCLQGLTWSFFSSLDPGWALRPSHLHICMRCEQLTTPEDSQSHPLRCTCSPWPLSESNIIWANCWCVWGLFHRMNSCTYNFLDLPRDAEWMIRGTCTPYLRVQTAPFGRCWFNYVPLSVIHTFAVTMTPLNGCVKGCLASQLGAFREKKMVHWNSKLMHNLRSWVPYGWSWIMLDSTKLVLYSFVTFSVSGRKVHTC